MVRKATNRDLNAAKVGKNDEFYTQLSDIEKELKRYKNHFKGKVILCNCDDPRASNFFHYFSYSFQELGLKKLITTCYRSIQPNLFSNEDSERGMALEYFGKRDAD